MEARVSIVGGPWNHIKRKKLVGASNRTETVYGSEINAVMRGLNAQVDHAHSRFGSKRPALRMPFIAEPQFMKTETVSDPLFSSKQYS